MKNIYIIGAGSLALAIALSGCEKPQAPQPQITQTEDGKTQVAVQQPEDHTVRDMAIGAAGGYLLSRVLGGGGSSQPAPAPVHNTTVIQKKTVIVNKVVEAPKPKVEPPKPRPSFTPSRPASRPSFSSTRRK